MSPFSLTFFLTLLLVGHASLSVRAAGAQNTPFSVPAGLQDTVDFWQQVFTRYGTGEVILFDPLDPGKIYGVVRAAETEQGRALVSTLRARIAAEYDLADDEMRVRSQRGAKEHFTEGLRISGRYISQMQKIFRDEGLPSELAYLPLVESSFNVHARSSAGAVGMWQFIPETGKKFMRIDDAVDERRDPTASTRAAARLLKENYRIFRSWPLALTAYNHGTEGIFRGIESVGSRDLVELIRQYRSPTFGFASKNFYAEFLAVIEIAKRPEKYFPFLRLHQPVVLRTVEVKKSTVLDAVLRPAAISHTTFFQWNPALEAGTKIIPAGYRVNLPAEKIRPFVAAQARAAASPVKKSTGGVRKVAAQPESAPRASKTSSNRPPKSVPAASSPGAKHRTKDRVIKDSTDRQSLKIAAR